MSAGDRIFRGISVLIAAVSLGLIPAGSADADPAPTYDSEGHLVNVIYDDGSSVSYEYDSQGRLVTESHSDGTVIRYDENGNPID